MDSRSDTLRQAKQAYSEATRSWDDCVQLLAISFKSYPDGKLPDSLRREYYRDLKAREALVKKTESEYLEALHNEA